MDTLFWIGQADWLAFLACGAYLSFCFWKLSDEESSRKAELEQHVPENAQPASHSQYFILRALD